MPQFIPLASSMDAVIYIHAAGCGKVATKRKGWVRCVPIEAVSAKAAQAEQERLELADGRDDILVSICPCARKA